MPRDSGSADDVRRKILRKVKLFTLASFAAAVITAAGGAALVAWLLRPTGLPFVETWLVLGVLILGIPLLGLALRRWRRGE